MAKEKEIKTNAMRILDRQKIKYEVLQYECDDKVYVSGGRIGTTLCMAPEDLKKVSRAEYADFIQ